MSTESDLKKMFSETGATLGQVDLSRVLRRSSRRRIAQQVAVGSATTLAVAGIGVAGFTGIRGLAQSTGSASSAAAPDAIRPDANRPEATGGSTATDSGLTRAPAERINLCGGALAKVAPNAAGLVLTTSFEPADAAADRVSGTVTITNSGSAHVTGTSAATPTIVLSKNGIVLWHSNGPVAAIGAIVDLAPGASMTYQASFQPVTCAVEDDSSVSFRDNLPHVAAGAYQVSAALDLSRQNADGSFPGTDLVTGPASEVTLR
ncbi:MAG: hypothetical protein H7279_10420 [Microbacteriaceae bacterium]|nr:hypothetical protein [Microbacteriaceae bacterium]